MGDLHLPFGGGKPMDIFSGWDNYTERLEENWNRLVSEDDLTVIPGDLCWAMKLEDALPDFEFVSRRLNGRKVIFKGNHDYWWTTQNKMEQFLSEHGFDNIKLLNNNAVIEGGIAICGTRGWINDDGQPQDLKLLNREAGRLETSIKVGIALGGEPIVFLHYPPIYAGEENTYILDVLHKYDIKRCYYGHVHGRLCFYNAFQGERDGITYKMVSADYVKFTPVLVQE
ncbi:MAG: metallophosphoesterase [Eubacterium sp.]|nr:metallophosphoesterase [Eubacterium sp.]